MTSDMILNMTSDMILDMTSDKTSDRTSDLTSDMTSEMHNAITDDMQSDTWLEPWNYVIYDIWLDSRYIIGQNRGTHQMPYKGCKNGAQ